MPLLPFKPLLDYTLHPKRVDLWYVSLLNEPSFILSILNAEEQARARRFYFPRHQRRFAVAHAALRWIISQYLACSATELTFTHNRYGKPSLSHSQALEFNLSHSQDVALIAIGQEHPLGVDLEFFSQRPYIDLAKTLFSPKEIASLEAASPTTLQQAFFHLWAQKEAFIKACGMGLAYPTQSFDAALFPHQTRDLRDPLTNTAWHLQAFTPAMQAAAAICTTPLVTEFHFHVWELPDAG